jgi:HIRAN domain
MARKKAQKKQGVTQQLSQASWQTGSLITFEPHHTMTSPLNRRRLFASIAELGFGGLLTYLSSQSPSPQVPTQSKAPSPEPRLLKTRIPNPNKPRLALQDSPLRGFEYRQPKALLYDMAPGDSLVFVAEPTNPHDSNAVRVHWQGRHIGYLPRENNEHASRLLRQGAELQGNILSLDPEHSCQPILMAVHLA